MGSAALFHLARRGRRVLGLEQFEVPHTRGSMHGATRIIRVAYFEHPDYVPLVQRAYELWRELETLGGEQLLYVTGALEVGPADGLLIPGTIRACEVHDLAHDVLEPADVRRRYPAFEPPEGSIAIDQPDGGFVLAEQAVRAHAAQAVAAGAELRTGEPVLDWEAREDGVTVRTAAGTYEADRLVLTPGAWAAGLLRLPPELFRVERQVLGWFEPVRSEELTPDRMPVFIFEQDGIHHYGFPVVDELGLKLGRMHYPGQVVPPESGIPDASPDEAEPLHEFLRRCVPAAAGRLVEARSCLFTMLPDENFLLDLHPTEPNVVIASACSGHGFKFAPVVGEILADLALDGFTRHAIDFLRYTRLDG